MKKFFHTVKHWDIILIITIVLFSFLPLAVFSYYQSGNVGANAQYVAVLSVDAEEVKRVTLTGHTGTDIFEIHSDDGGQEVVEVTDGKIRVKSDNCPDQICVRTGYISKPGQTIVCLPHKFLIEIQTENGSIDDDIIISS